MADPTTTAPKHAPRPAPRPAPAAAPAAPQAQVTFDFVQAEIEAGQKALEAAKARFEAEQEAGRKAVESAKARTPEA